VKHDICHAAGGIVQGTARRIFAAFGDPAHILKAAPPLASYLGPACYRAHTWEA
jgi:hypothetical protein